MHLAVILRGFLHLGLTANPHLQIHNVSHRFIMNWQELKADNLPKQGSWILITDGTDWRRVFVTNQFEFVEHPDDIMAYSQGITHWCEVTLP